MNNIKPIKNNKDYKEAVELIEKLMALNPDPESTEGEQLGLLAMLIQDYESKKFPKNHPAPIEAIKFRMEQLNLKPSDLAQFIGSPSRVSEILSGKRQLTLGMVRALESGLGIPAKILIQKPSQDMESQFKQWDQRLFKEMKLRGYFEKFIGIDNKIDILKKFFTPYETRLEPVAFLRKTNYRLSPLTNKDAILAWTIRVLNKAKDITAPIDYSPGSINFSFMQNLIKLSLKKDGPVLAQKYLKKAGVILIIEPHLSKTHLDGAVILDKTNPIIGLTLRHNRLDNFWFTLIHELAHVTLHSTQDIGFFYDENLQDKDKKNSLESNSLEKEADKMAEEVILPKKIWGVSSAKITPSPMAAQSLANELGINVAVAAGMIRYKHQNYYYLNKIINNKNTEVRKLFPDVFK